MKLRYRWDRIMISLAILFFWLWFCGVVWRALHAK